MTKEQFKRANEIAEKLKELKKELKNVEGFLTGRNYNKLDLSYTGSDGYRNGFIFRHLNFEKTKALVMAEIEFKKQQIKELEHEFKVL